MSWGTWECGEVTKKDFVILCLRLMAIYFIMIGVGSLHNAIQLYVGNYEGFTYVFVSPLIYIVSGLAIYVYAPRMCRFIVAFSEAEENNVQIVASEKTTRIALLVLGVYIFAHALPRAIETGVNVGLYYKSLAEVPSHLRRYEPKWTELIGPFLKLIIAAVLIIGPDKIVGVLGRYDETFRRVKSSDESTDS